MINYQISSSNVAIVSVSGLGAIEQDPDDSYKMQFDVDISTVKKDSD